MSELVTITERGLLAQLRNGTVVREPEGRRGSNPRAFGVKGSFADVTFYN